MLAALVAIIVGLPLLLWSAGRFVSGAAGVAHHLGVSPLLIGMLIIGFGTSAPEIIVSIFAALQGNAGIALGNAYGSNIANIALILGITALICPIAVRSEIIRRELPVLLAVTFFASWQLIDRVISFDDAFSLLGLFILLLCWSIWQAIKGDKDKLADEFSAELNSDINSLSAQIIWLLTGLLVLIASSRVLVWGAVEVAQYFGLSDTLIGLTIIAVGTSLPELAAALVAVKKGEHDLALGNIIGSNMFNTLAVVGIAGVIQPMQVPASFLYRDVLMMLAATVVLFVFCIGFKGPGRLNRLEGGILLSGYLVYSGFLLSEALASA